MADIKIIAGPCMLQGVEDINLAQQMKNIGVDVFRCKITGGGTHLPKDEKLFGLKEAGIRILHEIAKILPVAIEINVELAEEINMLYSNNFFDWIWTPARQMQNYNLLDFLNDEYHDKKVILKRGFGNTIDEVMGATEYLDKVKELYICDRGINTFDRRPDSRWIPDFKGMLELIQKGYKVIYDPSHSLGLKEYILPMSKAAVQLGINGLMIEAREKPEESWSDKAQCLSLKELESLIKEVRNV